MALIDVAEAIAHIEGWYSNKVGGTLGQRLNNPGNLTYAGQAGATPVKVGNYTFASWKTEQEGWNGLYNQINLDAGRGLDIESFVYKYAPPTDNNSETYIEQLTSKLGLSRTDSLADAIDSTTHVSSELTSDASVGFGITEWFNSLTDDISPEIVGLLAVVIGGGLLVMSSRS